MSQYLRTYHVHSVNERAGQLCQELSVAHRLTCTEDDNLLALVLLDAIGQAAALHQRLDQILTSLPKETPND